MDQDSGTYEMAWRGVPDRVLVRWKLLNVSGEIFVCGNYAMSGHTVRRLSRKAMADVSILMNNRPLVENIRYFKQYRSETALVGGTASCQPTGVAVAQAQNAQFGIGNVSNSGGLYRD